MGSGVLSHAGSYNPGTMGCEGLLGTQRWGRITLRPPEKSQRNQPHVHAEFAAGEARVTPIAIHFAGQGFSSENAIALQMATIPRAFALGGGHSSFVSGHREIPLGGGLAGRVESGGWGW